MGGIMNSPKQNKMDTSHTCMSHMVNKSFSICGYYPCFNNFETRINPLNRKQQTREYCETKTAYAEFSGILLLKYGRLNIRKSKSSRL